jgi:hypothetical protein
VTAKEWIGRILNLHITPTEGGHCGTIHDGMPSKAEATQRHAMALTADLTKGTVKSKPKTFSLEASHMWRIIELVFLPFIP